MSDDEREFEWDARKSRTNEALRGLPLAAGAEVFSDPRLVVEEDEFAVGEQRFIATGWGVGRVLTVVFSEPDERTIRLISVRPATASERRKHARSLS